MPTQSFPDGTNQTLPNPQENQQQMPMGGNFQGPLSQLRPLAEVGKQIFNNPAVQPLIGLGKQLGDIFTQIFGGKSNVKRLGNQFKGILQQAGLGRPQFGTQGNPSEQGLLSREQGMQQATESTQKFQDAFEKFRYNNEKREAMANLGAVIPLAQSIRRGEQPNMPEPRSLRDKLAQNISLAASNNDMVHTVLNRLDNIRPTAANNTIQALRDLYNDPTDYGLTQDEVAFLEQLLNRF